MAYRICQYKYAIFQWFSNFFWVAAHLEEFDSTAGHLELLHQIYSFAFTLLVKNFVQNIVTLNEQCKSKKFRSHFNVNQYSAHCTVLLNEKHVLIYAHKVSAFGAWHQTNVLSARQALADLCFFEGTYMLSIFVSCLVMPKYLSIFRDEQDHHLLVILKIRSSKKCDLEDQRSDHPNTVILKIKITLFLALTERYR